MGLDITAYSCVEFIEVLPDFEIWAQKYVDAEPPLGYETDCLTAEQDFPDRLAPLFVPATGIAVYKIIGETFEFRAGPYSYYNRWREELSMLATSMMPREIWNARNRVEIQRLPFYLLIDFSDCDGAIGTYAARVLTQEFAQFQHLVDGHPDDDFRELYADFRKAFRLAAKSGHVSFH